MFLELINLEIAEKLYYNWDAWSESIKWDSESSKKIIKKTKKNQKAYLKKIIDKAKVNGITQYAPSEKKDYGRVYADSPSLQGLKRQIRNTICNEFYDDLDMSKCQARIALWKCKLLNLPHNHIQEYIDNPELKSYKSTINKVMFGGKLCDIGNHNEWLVKFQHQMKTLGTYILGDNHDSNWEKDIIAKVKKAKENKWGKCLANVLQKYENDILESVFLFLDERGIPLKHLVKIFDGFLLPKEYLTQELLVDINAWVFKQIGIQVDFVSKSFDELIDTNAFVINETKTILQVLDEFMETNTDYVKNINGVPWIFDLTTGMWSKNNFGFFMKLCADTFGRGNIYGGNHRNIKDLFIMTQSLPDSSEFYIQGIDLRKGKLLYKNGIKDIEKNTFTTEFCNKYFFTKRITREYNPVRDEIMIERTKKVLFEDPHKPAIAKELIKALGLAMTGKNIHEAQYENLGSGSNGKSVMMASLLNGFEGYVEPFNISTLRVSAFAKANEHNDGLVATADIRIGFSSESGAGLIVDSEQFKKLITQEPQNARECGEKQVKIKPEMTLFSFGQNPLVFDKIDTAVQRRRKGFPWNKTFSKVLDGTLDFLKSIESYQALDHILQDGYNDWVVDKGFIQIEELELFKEDIDGEQDIFGESFETKFEKATDKENQDNWISSTDIYRSFKELKMSDWAIKKKLADLGIDCKRCRKNEKLDPKDSKIVLIKADINPRHYFIGIISIF